MITFAAAMRPAQHRYFYTLLLTTIYVLHGFLLYHILSSDFICHAAGVNTSVSNPDHYPHHDRRSGIAYLRMLEKHDGSKQSIALPADAKPILPVQIAYRVADLNAHPVDFTDCSRLSPSSYRLYLRDRVFLI